MKATEQEYPSEEMGAGTAARQYRSPQNPTRKQAEDGLKNRGFPMERNNLLDATPLDVVNGCKGQADDREYRPDLPLRTSRIVHHGYKEEHQGSRLRQNNRQIQSRKGANQHRQVAERRKSKAAPSRKPKTEITFMMIAADQKKQNEQDD